MIAATSSAGWAQSKANRTVGVERTVQPGALEFFYLSRDNPIVDPAKWTDPHDADGSAGKAFWSSKLVNKEVWLAG